MEKTNIRYVTPEDLGEEIDFSSIDVSFISLTKVLEPIRNYLAKDGEIVALIKPQFEAGREKVGKKGVVREKSTHREVIQKIMDYAMSIGFDLCALDFSPIKGPEGNIEYLIHLKKSENEAVLFLYCYFAIYQSQLRSFHSSLSSFHLYQGFQNQQLDLLYSNK